MSFFFESSIGAGSASSVKTPFDYAGSFQASDLHKDCLERITEVTGKMSDAGRVSFPNRYATSGATQMKETLRRAIQIYWRSPSYNTIRLLTSTCIALVFGSIYVADMTISNEADMNSRATSVFVAELFLGVNSLITVLALFETERNMFYRHKAALMYTNRSILAAFTIAEIPFILGASMIFVVIFYFMIGFAVDVTKFFLFYLFFMLNMAVWTFLGQMFVALTRNSLGAQGLGSLFLSLTSLFTGVLIRPSNIPNFWIFMFWLMPGHYVFEGLLTSQFRNDNTPILASPNSPFWVYRGCQDIVGDCFGTAEEWVFATFGGDFVPENIPWNIVYLVLLILATRVVTGVALAHLNFRST
jgi:ABC-type multidrug transport system permease subunit